LNTRYLLKLTAVVVVAAAPSVMPAAVSAQGFNPMGWMDPARWMDRHGYGDGYGLPGYGVPGYGPGHGPAYPPAGYGYGAPYGGGYGTPYGGGTGPHYGPGYAPGYAPAQGLPSHGQGRPDYGWEPAPGTRDPDRESRGDESGGPRPSAGEAFRGTGMRDPWLDSAPPSDGASGSSRSAPWNGGGGSAWPPKTPSPAAGGGKGDDHDQWPGGHSGRASGWGVPGEYDRPRYEEDFVESAPGATLPPAAIDWPDRSRETGQGRRDKEWGTTPPARDLPHGGRWPSGERWSSGEQ